MLPWSHPRFFNNIFQLPDITVVTVHFALNASQSDVLDLQGRAAGAPAETYVEGYLSVNVELQWVIYPTGCFASEQSQVQCLHCWIFCLKYI